MARVAILVQDDTISNDALMKNSTMNITHQIICDDEGRFEMHRAGVMTSREPLGSSGPERIDFANKRTLSVSVHDATDEEALRLAVRITGQFVRCVPLRTFGSAHVANRKRQAEIFSTTVAKPDIDYADVDKQLKELEAMIRAAILP